MFSSQVISLTLLLAGLGSAIAGNPTCQKQATDTCQVFIIAGYAVTLSGSPAPGTDDKPTFGTSSTKSVTIVNDSCDTVFDRKSDDLQNGIGTHEDYYLSDGSELVLYTAFVSPDDISGIDYYYYPNRHYEDHSDETDTKYTQTDCREESGHNGLNTWRALWCPFKCNANLPNPKPPAGVYNVA